MWKRDSMPKPANSPMDPPQPTATTAPPPAPAIKPVEPRQTEQLVMDLGKSVRIKGELSASEDMTLCGQMEGRVTLPEHSLTIGPEADIRAEIKASTVVIMGVVLGNVTASKKIDLRSTGSVTGDIAAPRIVIADGGQILGKVQITGEKAQARRTA
jgi:cytoskeletal protein CcmA (bactofilin family)